MKDIAIAYIEQTDAFIEIELIDIYSVGYVYNIILYWESTMKKRIFHRVKYAKVIVGNHSKALKQALEDEAFLNYYDYFTDSKMSKRDKKYIENLKSNYKMVVI